MTWTDHIHADPAVLGCKPVIKGIRLAVDFGLALRAEGWSRKELQKNYPQLTDDALPAVFANAAEVLHDHTLQPIRPGASLATYLFALFISLLLLDGCSQAEKLCVYNGAAVAMVISITTDGRTFSLMSTYRVWKSIIMSTMRSSARWAVRQRNDLRAIRPPATIAGGRSGIKRPSDPATDQAAWS